MQTWNLAKTNYQAVKETQYEVAVLPLGATEPHNLHLPYGTDLFEGTIVGEKICEEADRRGAKVVLLPTIPFGTETNMRNLPLAINVNPTTLYSFVTDVIDSLRDSGIRKVLLLNSHGGNGMKPLLRELSGCGSEIFLCDWFRTVDDVYEEIFEHKEDHAGEMETSFGLAFFPELVATKENGELLADDGSQTPLRFEALQKGWVSISRRWDLLTTNSGSGNPHAATKEKGEKLMSVLVERLATFLVELSDSKIDDTFPFATREN